MKHIPLVIIFIILVTISSIACQEASVTIGLNALTTIQVIMALMYGVIGLSFIGLIFEDRNSNRRFHHVVTR
jgi:3-polyprenyl-4-hydroxybenzoate decarboxylase